MSLKKFFCLLKKTFVLFLYLFNPRKKVIERNLDMIGIIKNKKRVAFQTYYNLFNSYLLLFLYSVFKKTPSLIIHNEEYLKNGRIFVSIHYGPWDLAMRVIHKKYPFVSIVGKRDLLNILRERQGIKLIYSKEGFAKIIRVLKKERVAIMLDRTFYEKGIWVLVGRSHLKISRAAIMLALRTKQDIYFLKTEFKNSTIEVFIKKIHYTNFDNMLKIITEIISETIVNGPQWWFNFFTLWKKYKE